MKVVAAFYPVAEAVQRVGGNRVDVTNLTPAGAEPHDLELTPNEVNKVQDAKVAFVMGHGFQPAVEKRAAERDDATVQLLDQLPINARSRNVSEALPNGTAPANALDPHVWLDPVLYGRLVDAVQRELSKVDPAARAAFPANAARFKRDIAGVDRRYRSGFAQCARKTIVTSHEAFGYLAQRYGLTQVGIAGLSPDQEPSARRIAQLTDLVRKDGITTIFTETLVSPKVAETVAREAGGLKTDTLDPLEGLTDKEIANGGNWASVMAVNLAKLRRALGCT
jgi:zinc transport system substrate-binding protein